MTEKEKEKDQTPTLVVALERGHDGGEVRSEGEQFSVPAWRLEDGSTWFVPVESAPAPKPPASRPPGSGPAPGKTSVTGGNNG